MIPFACVKSVCGCGDVASLMAAGESIVVAVDLGAISSVPRDGERDQRGIRSGR